MKIFLAKNGSTGLKQSQYALLWCLLLLITAGWAADVKPASDLDATVGAANAAYQAKDWPKAVTLYEQITKGQPDNARALYRLGVAQQALGQHDKALETLQKAKSKGVPIVFAGYSLAEVYASLGQTDKAFENLAEAVKQGYGQPEQMTYDPDLQPLRSDPRFAPLLEQARHNQTPCAYTPETRQFDFWVGDWDVVVTKEGTSAGTSHIERAIGDCVIWENWTSLGTGYFGKSYNTYNASLKRWEQFWVDNAGGMIHFYGGLQHGVMDFYTDALPQPSGPPLKRHLQFFNLGPDTVRQLSQGSTDGGKTWTVEYDFTYRRRK
jgi:tetratricopeptide (TPR) repeat protein